MKNRIRKKYVPIFVFGNYLDENSEHYDFGCYYVTGTYDKYGLRFINDIYDESEPEIVRLKGARYSRPPFAYNTYEEMMLDTKKRRQAEIAAENSGNTKKEAEFLCLSLDEEGYLKTTPHSFKGYVTKHGRIFRITSSGTYNGSKNIPLTEENKHLVFPDIKKAAEYVEENYGHYACSHYLKSFPWSL